MPFIGNTYASIIAGFSLPPFTGERLKLSRPIYRAMLHETMSRGHDGHIAATGVFFCRAPLTYARFMLSQAPPACPSFVGRRAVAAFLGDVARPPRYSATIAVARAHRASSPPYDDYFPVDIRLLGGATLRYFRAV